MEKVFWLMFYEDGKFSNALQNPHFSMDSAIKALAVFYNQLERAGFKVEVDSQEQSIKYDRYGTPCMIRIEEKED